MAGIGFLLKKLVQQDTYISDLKANLYSVIISSGPWLFSILCIAGLSVFAGKYSTGPHIVLFRSIIIYTYTFSMISSSLFQLILTRFISDKLYQREYSSLLPNFIGSMVLCGIISFLVSSAYMYFTPLNIFIKFICVVLYCTVSFQWIIMVFLSSLRDYIKVVLIYFIGFLVSFLAGILIGAHWGLSGYLIGFTIGQLFIVILLIERIVIEFYWGENSIFEFLQYCIKYPPLVFAAFLYNLGYWFDKIIIWYSPKSFLIEDSFRAHYPYDTSSFLAILTIVPAMSMFFLQVETDFYEKLRRYINTILNHGTYKDIETERRGLVEVTMERLRGIIQIQALITMICCLLAPWIVNFVGYNIDDVVPVFRLIIFAALFQILFLILIVLYWYLELLSDSLICISIFTVLNGGLTYFFVYYTDFTLGMGYLIAIILSCIFTILNLLYKIKYLNYITFLQKPTSTGQSGMPKFE